MGPCTFAVVAASSPGSTGVTYVGNESTTPAKPAAAGSSQREARRALEAHLQKGAAAASKSELDKIWNSLGSPDRGIRHASRAALEKQPVAMWRDRLVREKNLVASTAAMIALARTDAKNSASEIFKKATSIDYNQTGSRQTRLDILRGVTLTLTRSGQPSASDKAKLIKWIERIYPAQTPEENRDLSAMAAFLDAPFAVGRGMKLLENASGQEEQIGYALNLRHLNRMDLTTSGILLQMVCKGRKLKGGARLSNYLDGIKRCGCQRGSSLANDRKLEEDHSNSAQEQYPTIHT